MKKITVICREPGFRRLGMAHPHTGTYSEGYWTDAQLDQLRADPMFEVIETELAGGAPIPNVELAGVGGDYVGTRELHGAFEIASNLSADLVADIRRFVLLAIEERSSFDEVKVRLDAMLAKHGIVTEAVDAAGAIAAARPAVREPAAVAPGADASDAVQDNGAGFTVNDLGAKAAGVGEAAGVVTADGVRPPVFDDARIQSIRSAIAGLGAEADVKSQASQRKLRRTLGFEPSAEEIAAASVEAAFPGAVIGT